MIHKNKSTQKLKKLKQKLRRNLKPLKCGLMKIKQFLKTRLIHGSTICPIMSSRLSNRLRTKKLASRRLAAEDDQPWFDYEGILGDLVTNPPEIEFELLDE